MHDHRDLLYFEPHPDGLYEYEVDELGIPVRLVSVRTEDDWRVVPSYGCTCGRDFGNWAEVQRHLDNLGVW